MIRFSDKEREELKSAFESTPHRKVQVVYLRATGRARKEIAELFLITPATVTNYCRLYKAKGIEGLLANNYKGRGALLTPHQEADLQEFLNTNYVQGKALQAYLLEHVQLQYTVGGALRLAHRVG